MEWVAVRLWEAYSELVAAHARLPEERKQQAGDDASEQRLRELVGDAEDIARDAREVEASWRAALERESEADALSDELHSLTVDLMAALWQAHEVARQLAQR